VAVVGVTTATSQLHFPASHGVYEYPPCPSDRVLPFTYYGHRLSGAWSQAVSASGGLICVANSPCNPGVVADWKYLRPLPA
jgi:hypothetical protein